MKNHEQVMSVRETARLGELEKTIAKGKKTFVEVGMALAEIRDLRLYKREYGSFREYCQKKWGWTKQHAYRLIEAAPVAKSNLQVTSQNAAIELVRIDPSQRDEVVQRITESGEPVTADAIKRHLPPPPTGPPKPPSPPPPPPPPPAPAKVRDKIGREIPEGCLEIWHRAKEAQDHLTAISRIRGALRKAQDNQDRLYAEICYSGAMSYLDQAYTELKTALPYTVCSSCQGHETTRATCRLCKGRGMISEYRWDTCVPTETKRIIAESIKAKG